MSFNVIPVSAAGNVWYFQGINLISKLGKVIVYDLAYSA